MKTEIPMFVLIVLLLLLYLSVYSSQKSQIEIPYLSKYIIPQKRGLTLIYLFTFILWGVMIWVTFRAECPLNTGIHSWIPVREVKSGLLVVRKETGGRCESVYVFCMDGKCPKLFVNLALEVTQTGEKLQTKIKSIQLPTANSPFQYILYLGNEIKMAAYSNLRDYYGEEVGGLYISMLFGGEYVPKNIHENMKRAGLLHIVAVSGMNISVFLSIAAALLKKLPRIARLFTNSLLLVIFIAISGLTPPTVRAILGASIVLLFQCIGVKQDQKYLFPIVIIVCLLLFPEYSESISFYLTCTAVFAVMYVCPLVIKFFAEKIKGNTLFMRIGRNALTIVLECFIVEIFINICLYIYFGELSLWGFVTSLLAAPVVDLFSLLGYLSFPFVLMGGYVGRLLSLLPAMYCYLLIISLKLW